MDKEIDPHRGPKPRCLAVLPQNIEELVSKFNAQIECSQRKFIDDQLD